MQRTATRDGAKAANGARGARGAGATGRAPLREAPIVGAAEVRPWWREFYVWMVIAGPVSVVIACAITGVYILRGPDALVSEDYYREGIALGQQLKNAAPPMEPAQTGRNHSATGGKNAAGNHP